MTLILIYIFSLIYIISPSRYAKSQDELINTLYYKGILVIVYLGCIAHLLPVIISRWVSVGLLLGVIFANLFKQINLINQETVPEIPVKELEDIYRRYK